MGFGERETGPKQMNCFESAMFAQKNISFQTKVSLEFCYLILPTILKGEPVNKVLFAEWVSIVMLGLQMREQKIKNSV